MICLQIAFYFRYNFLNGGDLCEIEIWDSARVAARKMEEKYGKEELGLWDDFEKTVARIEKAYKEVYGAEPLNWGCYMNHAFRTKPFNPHVHWHIYPRYQTAPILDGVEYDDPLFGNFYDTEVERLVDDKTTQKIAEKLAEYLARN